MPSFISLIPTATPSAPAGLSLVDLILVVLVLGAFISGLRRRRSLLGATGSALGAAVLCVIIAGAVVVWAPTPWSEAVTNSALAQHVPLPLTALRQIGPLAQHLTGQGGGITH